MEPMTATTDRAIPTPKAHTSRLRIPSEISRATNPQTMRPSAKPIVRAYQTRSVTAANTSSARTAKRPMPPRSHTLPYERKMTTGNATMRSGTGSGSSAFASRAFCAAAICSSLTPGTVLHFQQYSSAGRFHCQQTLQTHRSPVVMARLSPETRCQIHTG